MQKQNTLEVCFKHLYQDQHYTFSYRYFKHFLRKKNDLSSNFKTHPYSYLNLLFIIWQVGLHDLHLPSLLSFLLQIISFEVKIKKVFNLKTYQIFILKDQSFHTILLEVPLQSQIIKEVFLHFLHARGEPFLAISRAAYTRNELL